MKWQTAVAVMFFCSTALTSPDIEEDQLEVTLFYESYCPYCKKYVEDQLVRVYTLFADHMQLELVPYGNANQRLEDDHWVFECQHGDKECLGNKLHACAIYQVCGDSGTVTCEGDKVSQVLTYISCVMKHKDQLTFTSQCADTSEMDADTIISCANGDKGDQLLNFYGYRTEEFPARKGVPYVTINGEQDDAARHNLMERLCELKPVVCSKTEPDELQY